jgi:hypothetical protein
MWSHSSSRKDTKATKENQTLRAVENGESSGCEKNNTLPQAVTVIIAAEFCKLRLREEFLSLSPLFPIFLLQSQLTIHSPIETGDLFRT